METEMESKEANKVKIEIELVDNGAILDYTDLGLKFITKHDSLVNDLGRDIVAEMNEYQHKKFLVEISVKPI